MADAEKNELKGRPQENPPVIWVHGTSPKELDQLDLPRPTIFKERTLVAKVEGGEIGVGVFALPSEKSSGSKFWNKIKHQLGIQGKEQPKPGATRLQIEPKIPLDDFKKGEQTPISALYPHVVMEDDTRYGIGVWIPKGMVGQWSEPKERASGGNIFKFTGVRRGI